MKHKRIVIALVLLVSLLLSSCGQAFPRMTQTALLYAEAAPKAFLEPAAKAEEEKAPAPETAAEAPALLSAFREAPADVQTVQPMAPAGGKVEPVRVTTDMFRAKFEGSAVSGSGEAVGGVYRFAATQTDGEAWHVKLECNYPTVAGRDYRISYRFHSDVAGKVKFGDFQEFEIREGDNSLTGILTASSGTSYLDLQLGMLPPFTIDFSEIEVEEYADEVDYENALPSPVNFERETLVFEKHDQGYAPVLTRSKDGVSVEYLATSWDSGIWKSRLYIRTGLIPEPGVHYRVTADIKCDQDMPFEVLFNNGDEEKGYGALYGQNLTAGETKTCEAVITGSGDGDDLVMQFSLGEVPEGSVVDVSNLRVEKIKDHYTSVLPALFALDSSVETGKMLTAAIPTSFKNVPLNFSYSGTDTVFENHESGYKVSLEESGSSATLRITKAPESGREPWKVALNAATGVPLEAGKLYQITFDLKSTSDQGEYVVCFGGDTGEKDYGALYGRTLSAGVTDSVEFIVTPDASHGPLTLKLQVGNTNTTSGNSFTLSNLCVKKLDVEYKPVGNVDLSTDSTGNVSEEHFDGIEQALTAYGDSVALNITAARNGSEGGVWSSKLLIKTGIIPEAGEKYRVSAAVDATGDTGVFEFLYQNSGSESLYGEQKGLSGPGTYGSDFTAPASGCGELVLVFQLGDAAAGTRFTVSDLQLRKLTTEESAVDMSGFAYPVTTDPIITPVEAGYAAQAVSLSVNETHDSGYEQAMDGNILKINALPSVGVWKSRLFAHTGVTLEKGEQYRVSVTLKATKAINPFEVLLGNGAEENGTYNPGGKGYYDGSDCYGQSIAAGETKTLTYTFTVPDRSEYKELVFRFQMGNSPAENEITVTGVTVEKWVPAHNEITGGNTENNDFDLDKNVAGSGTDAVLTGNGTSATVKVLSSDSTDWHLKLYANTGAAFESGKKYRVDLDISGANGWGICYKYPTGDDHDFTSRESGARLSCTIASAEQTAELQLVLKLGQVAVDGEVTIGNIKVYECTPVEAGYAAQAVSLSVNETHDSGYEQAMDGNILKINALPSVGVWKSRLFAHTGVTLEKGEQYRVSVTLKATKAINPFEVLLGNGAEENGTYNPGGKGYYDGSDCYGQSIAAGETKTLTYTFTVPDRSEYKELVFRFQMGNSPAENEITVTGVTVEKWVPAHNEITGGNTENNDFDLDKNVAGSGTDAVLTGNGTSATVKVLSSDSTDWHLKLYANTGAAFESGKKYRVDLDISGANGWGICYKYPTGDDRLFDDPVTVNGSAVSCTVTPAESGIMTLVLKLGKVTEGERIIVSGISITEINELPGDNLMPSLATGTAGNVSFGAHEDYAAGLSGSGSSASLAINAAPSDGREAWKVKLFVNTDITLEAGKLYRVSADVSATTVLDYELCCNDAPNGGGEQALGFKNGLQATADAQTIYCDAAATVESTLNLQFNLGKAAAPCTVTISNVKVEELLEGESANVLPSFSYDSVGFISRAADDGYVTSLKQSSSSATLNISKAPSSNRNPWNVKFNIRTGLTPEKNKGYRVSFDLNAAKAQNAFEIFYDGSSESAYGSQYNLSLAAGKNSFSYLIYPGESKGELVLQLRSGKTDGKDGNTYTFSNLKIEEVTFRYTQTPEVKEVTTLVTQNGYIEQLEKTRDRATVRIEKTPPEGREAWKSKLFVETGVTLRPGQKYRVSMDVKSIIPTPFEVCFNNGGVEKGLGAMFGLISTPSGQHVEYITYAKEATQLVIQLSLGNCAPPNSIMLSNVKVEKAGAIDLVSDTIYTF